LTARLNPTSGTPLYVQLVERLKHSIATGAIRAGDQLPSVRKMAGDLLINPNTVVRLPRPRNRGHPRIAPRVRRVRARIRLGARRGDEESGTPSPRRPAYRCC
jgi:DNA-binding transcriptional MocR family regulator